MRFLISLIFILEISLYFGQITIIVGSYNGSNCTKPKMSIPFMTLLYDSKPLPSENNSRRK
jgi:hypothetical protein